MQPHFSAVRQQRKDMEAIKAALSECADDLESMIAAQYAGSEKVYWSQRQKFDRDMEPVNRARALLKEPGK
jgi:hypothetical protein